MIGRWIGLYFVSLITFFAIDLLWLGFFAKNFYQTELKAFLSPQVNWTAACIFYCLFLVGVQIFCVVPSLEKKSFIQAIILGVLFGFFTYITYDLTNLATLKDWPIKVVIVDVVWGMFITGAVSAVSYWFGTNFLKMS